LEGQRSITVKRQFNRVTLDFTAPKSKKPRVVPCNQVLLNELKSWIDLKKMSPTDTIFQNENGKPICHDNFADRRFQKNLKAWGGRPIRFHDMRHTATTLLIASGVDLKTVKEICGHADIATTMNYVHMVSGAIEKVALNFSITPTKGESRNLKIV
ncbi:MAG: tyrosine-type recombinase/integrase, partial [Bdellovibrionales bacterium]